MSAATSIEWTDVTWNPVRGCARVSAGCENCYAERVAYRFGRKPGSPYEGLTVLGKHGPRWVGEARYVPNMLGEPLTWRKPRRVFVNSMSDLFHEDIANEHIAEVFGVMAVTPRHTYQVLTKRPARMLQWFEWASEHYSLATAEPRSVGWPLSNVWLGVSCENQANADDRIPLLLDCPAAVRFISAEPLLEELHLFAFLPGEERDQCLCILNQGAGPRIPALDWVIVGGESGPGARACDTNWIRAVRDQCERAGVPCFVKQLGSHLQTELASVRFKNKGNALQDMPADLRVRQFPEARP